MLIAGVEIDYQKLYKLRISRQKNLLVVHASDIKNKL